MTEEPIGIRTSEETDKILPALFAAQQKMTAAPKTSTNPFYSSTYADLGTVMETIKEPLSANDLFIVHGSRFLGAHAVNIVHKDAVVEIDVARRAVSTRVYHAPSSQWIEMELVADSRDTSAQAAGALLTYMRRQGIKSVFAIPEVDDDGNEASDASRAAARSRPAKPRAAAPVQRDLQGVPEYKFKPHQGEPISDVPKADLEFYIGKLLERVEEKPKYRDSNAAYLRSVRDWLVEQDDTYAPLVELYGDAIAEL